MKNVIEAFGWYGAGAIVGAYLLVSFDVVSARSAVYQLLNLSGAIGIVTVSWMKQAMQPAVLNAIWSVIAAAALVHMAV